ncbi:nitronate monooxygenase [Rhodobacteraceae bacterium NNCM2]|nr:nitronate monooxygenase [Coraliihabitans acroporae]
MSTRLTKKLGLDHPVIQAPMAFAGGGKLASAVSAAGGLGLVGGGYGDRDWIADQIDIAGNQPIGCGFITWALNKQPELLDMVLERGPSAIFLSFGDPAPFMDRIGEAGVPVICQVQTLRDAKHAIALGASVIVAQGSEAGGHGERRATFTLVPEVADYIAGHAPETLLCAAGGVADGRGLAAALMLGADGVLVGSRFWASDEALVQPDMLQAGLDATGDDTIRTNVVDFVRGYDWPERYSVRVLQNEFTDKWHGDVPGLAAELTAEAAKWQEGWTRGDPSKANTFIGEGAGLIRDKRPAASILEDMVREAEQALATKYE